jgi:gamma-glutamyltranspeptidase/glutathione hydrolase
VAPRSPSRAGAAIAAGHPVTAQVGADVLAAGGSAVDACVAAGVASWVSEPTVTGMGGAGFMVVYDAARHETVALDFFVAVPSGESEVPMEELVLQFAGTTQLFLVGPSSCAVPGLPAGLAQAHRRFGRMPWPELIAPAIALARRGVAVIEQHAALHILLDELFRLGRPEIAAILSPNGRPPMVGELLANPALAETLERYAANGAAEAYTGETGRAIVDYLAERGGRLRYEDMAAYRVHERPALTVPYRGLRLATVPPPASGGTLIAYALAVLDRLPLARDPFDPASLRLLAGALREAQAARTPAFEHALYRGDAAGLLLTPARIEAAARAVASGHPHIVFEPSGAPNTTHVSVVDADGNAAAMTSTTGSGSGVIAGATGVHVNNMLGEVDLAPRAVTVVPGERLTSMMSPTIISRPVDNGDARVELVLGSSGSTRIRSAIVQVLVHIVDHGLPLQESIIAPRLHPEGDVLECEHGFPDEALDALEAAGEPVSRWSEMSGYFGGVQAVSVDEEGRYDAGADPRRGGGGVVLEAR